MFHTPELSLRDRSGHTESRSGNVIAVITATQVLSTIFLALRLWTRVGIQRMHFAKDDWTIIISWVFGLAYGIDVALQTRYGLGKHLADLPPETDFITSNILFYAKQPVYYMSISLTKVSILFFYFRLFPQKLYRTFLWAMMAFVFLTGFACSVAGIFQCNPIHKAWDTDVPGTCFDRPALFFANASLNIFQDFVIYLLPSPMLWNIQIPVRQRLALIGIFVVGGFVCIAGIIRIPTLRDAVSSTDPTWDHYGSAIWSAIEINFAIVCASLVHLKPFFAKMTSSVLHFSTFPQRSKFKLSDDTSNPASAHLKVSGKHLGSNQVSPAATLELDDRFQDQSPLVPDQGIGRATAVTGPTVGRYN
ncbi:hypothetical protein F4824DRAFT_142805 [Ustulina deusta]|nr:hypothetical protein F4824DRAFT_142805 [Ustulina deusta]